MWFVVIIVMQASLLKTMAETDPRPFIFGQYNEEWIFIAVHPEHIESGVIPLQLLTIPGDNDNSLMFGRAICSQTYARSLMMDTRMMHGPDLYHLVDSVTGDIRATVWMSPSLLFFEVCLPDGVHDLVPTNTAALLLRDKMLQLIGADPSTVTSEEIPDSKPFLDYHIPH
jgi:hypothetical protein